MVDISKKLENNYDMTKTKSFIRKTRLQKKKILKYIITTSTISSIYTTVCLNYSNIEKFENYLKENRYHNSAKIINYTKKILLFGK
jgi:hypothetical protein